jgi:hypothetical protein
VPCFNSVAVAGLNVSLTGATAGDPSFDLLHADKISKDSSVVNVRNDFILYVLG